MTEAQLLNITVSYTSASDCSQILLFDYNAPGGRESLAYGVREHPKKRDFLKRNEINPDLSEVKTVEEAVKFKEEFMSKYPEANKVYEHLYEFDMLQAEEKRRFDLFATAHDVIYNNSHRLSELSDADRAQSFEYMKALFKAKSEGKDANDVPMMKRPLLDDWGIKRNKLYHSMAGIKQSFFRCNPTKEECGKIYKNLPDKPFETSAEADKFSREISKYNESGFNKKIRESFDTVAGDFIDIKIREDVSHLIDGKLRVHLQKLAKEERLQQQKEEQQANREKAHAENKAKGVQIREKMQQKRAAQHRLQEKGLIPELGEKNGKDVKWGDSRALLKSFKEKTK